MSKTICSNLRESTNIDARPQTAFSVSGTKWNRRNRSVGIVSGRPGILARGKASNQDKCTESVAPAERRPRNRIAFEIAAPQSDARQKIQLVKRSKSG